MQSRNGVAVGQTDRQIDRQTDIVTFADLKLRPNILGKRFLKRGFTLTQYVNER